MANRITYTISLTNEMADFVESIREASDIPVSRSTILEIALRHLAEARGYKSRKKETLNALER